MGSRRVDAHVMAALAAFALGGCGQTVTGPVVGAGRTVPTAPKPEKVDPDAVSRRVNRDLAEADSVQARSHSRRGFRI